MTTAAILPGTICAYVPTDEGRTPEVVRVHPLGAGTLMVVDPATGDTLRHAGAGGEVDPAMCRRVPDDYAEDEQAAEAYAAGLCDGRRGQPYRRDPRARAAGSSVWALARLAYRAGFRDGDPERRPVAVVGRIVRRQAAADEVRRIGSVPRTVDGCGAVRPAAVDKVRAILREARDRASRGAPPKPTAESFAAELGHFAEHAAAYRADCPQVCGADDSHLERLDRWRDDAADAAEAWAWCRRKQGQAARFGGLRGPGATPEAYVDALETGDEAAPDGRRAPPRMPD